MSITRTQRVTCRCGAVVEVLVAATLNANRRPQFKRALLDRTLHVFRCGGCGDSLVVERDLLYFDMNRQQMFCMYPRHERAREEELSEQVRIAYQAWLGDRAPKLLQGWGKGFLVRMCFGYEELREKVVIDDAGLSDLVIEALKIDVLTSDPWFEANEVLTLRFDHVEPSGDLAFFPEWLGDPPAADADDAIMVKRAVYDAIDARFGEILTRHPGLAKGAHVSLLRLTTWPMIGPPTS